MDFKLFFPLPIAFHAPTFFGTLLFSVVLGVLLFLALLLVSGDRSKERRDQYMVFAGVYVVLRWILSLLPLVGDIGLLLLNTVGIVWYTCSCLNIPLLRAVGVWLVWEVMLVALGLLGLGLGLR